MQQVEILPLSIVKKCHQGFMFSAKFLSLLSLMSWLSFLLGSLLLFAFPLVAPLDPFMSLRVSLFFVEICCPELDTILHLGSHQHQVERKYHFLALLSMHRQCSLFMFFT